MHAYGTPHTKSALSVGTDDLFDDFDSNNEGKEEQKLTKPPKKPKIVRIWHPDKLFMKMEDKDLDTITSFKSAKVCEETTVKDSRDFVGGKLLIEDLNQFGIFAIKDQGLFHLF